MLKEAPLLQLRKQKLKNSGLPGSLTPVILVQQSYQVSSQANWEVVIILLKNSENCELKPKFKLSAWSSQLI